MPPPSAVHPLRPCSPFGRAAPSAVQLSARMGLGNSMSATSGSAVRMRLAAGSILDPDMGISFADVVPEWARCLLSGHTAIGEGSRHDEPVKRPENRSSSITATPRSRR